MERNKPPALTSPWKIGFFVSLLLVTMAISVGFFVTRSFGLSWSWIAFAGSSWQSWKFDMDAFMSQMLPLVVLVPVLSTLSYFLITSAVRKYKRYLDSGLDYKNLLQSLTNIEDLNDESSIRKLSGHTELRDFLLNVKNRITEREEALDKKEHTLNHRAAATENGEALTAETNVLLSAIVCGPEGFGKELALSQPQLREIASAIRENLLAVDGMPTQNMDTVRGEFVRTAQPLRTRIEEVRVELVACENEARGVEQMLNESRASATEKRPGTAQASAAAQALDALGGVVQALMTLGEDAKGIAINAAMHASSAGDANMVGMAEEMRDVATRFGAAAKQWADSSGNARAVLGEAAVAQAPSGVDTFVSAAASKASMWVERSVLLSDKFRAFGKEYNEATDAIEISMGGQPAKGYPEGDDLKIVDPEPPDMREQFDDVGLDGIEQPGPAPILRDIAVGGAQTLAGIEKEKSLFDEIAPIETDSSGRFDPSSPEEFVAIENSDDDRMFEEIDEQAATAVPQPAVAPIPPADFLEPTSFKAPAREPGPVHIPDAAEEPERVAEAASEPAPELIPDPGHASEEDTPQDMLDDTEVDGLVTYPAVAHAKPGAEARASSEPTAFQSTTVESAPAAPEKDAFDLYELGAIDYEPGNVVHNT